MNMRKTVLFALCVCGVGAIAMLVSSPATTQTAGGFIALQSASPGTPQAGNMNISANGRFGGNVGIATNPTTAFNLDVRRNGWVPPAFNYRSAIRGSTGLGALTDCGVLGVTDNGNGVAGIAHQPEGWGVLGFSYATTGSGVGGHFSSASSAGQGVVGLVNATTGLTRGVYGESASIEGIGVYGEATALTGYTWGGKFVNHSDFGAGVYGSSESADGTGGYFEGAFTGVSGNGWMGVSGNSFYANGNGGFFTAFGAQGIGVWGRARGSTGLNYGVYGDTLSPAGWAGYFTGGMGVYAEKLSVGSSALVTNLNADLLDGHNGAYYNNAANLTGDIADARLSSNVALLNAVQTFTAANTFSANIDVNARTTTDNFTMLSGAAANTVLLGNVNGVASWGTVGNARLTSDADSLSKVTGGNFSISNGDMLGDELCRILLSTDSTTKVSINPNLATEGGLVTVNGPNGNTNVRLTYIAGFANNGAVGVYDSSGNVEAQMYVSSSGLGVVAADTKSFLVPDPTDPRFNIMYACVEGPEAAMYTRGTGQLVNGRAVIELPDHFLKLANMQTLTIQVTPLDECEGLFCKKLNGEIVVKELRKGQSNIEFDWEVKAVRKGHEDWEPVRPWDDALPEGDKKEQWTARLKSIEMKENLRREKNRRP